MFLWFLWSIVALILICIYNRFTNGRCYSESILIGKVAIITGSCEDTGYEIALELARRGATVIITGCDSEKGLNIAKKLRTITENNSVQYMHLNLSSLSSVRTFVKEFLSTGLRLDILVNNEEASGLITKTDDGIIRNIQINYFGPFLLTTLLVPALKKSAPSRVVITSSDLHKFGCTNRLNEPQGFFITYCKSKLCNVMFSNELSGRLNGAGVAVNSFTPGYVSTMFKNTFLDRLRVILRWFLKSCDEGAQTAIYLAVSEECDQATGKYFKDCKEASTSDEAMDPSTAAKLWYYSEEVVKLTPEERI